MRRVLLGTALAAAVACGGSGRERVLLVTTTTVESSGLLETLVEAYQASQDRYRLSVTAVGSGAALEIGRRGDADLLLTHDPTGEARFMAEGYGTEQGPVMRNQFVVAGPGEDPAGVRAVADLAAALARIAATESPFISRGDESGTHRKEAELWRRAGLEPMRARPAWYVESGSGMGETLRIADQRGAYILTDRGTFRHLAGGLRLELLARGDPPEANPYRYTVPRDPPNPAGARDLKEWLLGPGQDVI
ncbi:MAG: solute-binding protein, partial [Gemmatimonadetes bacterium]|nr:solute-binding protein [Gemmatimonadota bacterium]NIQ55718.1 solute-binding protein [Gemmatimonadota bacterium]NIU78272.1 solute-binding protein [Gammaproteobacteria bacterium]NIX43037.1 solute-binding protein [Gemmatimonadota bacterium]NIY07210.1 solute-binding protein [Gemmatimonadota bacterium]